MTMSGEIQLIELTFTLPEWAGDARFEKEVKTYYDSGHVWAGQVKGYRDENPMLDGLFALEGVKEVCLNMQNWVTVEFGYDLAKLPQLVAVFQESLRKFLQDERWMK